MSLPVSELEVKLAGSQEVNGRYAPRDPKMVPNGFAKTCAEMRWDSGMMWRRLSNQITPWWEAKNESYIYFNRGDGMWWMDGPDGRGLYIVEAVAKVDERSVPPRSGWERLSGASDPSPEVVVVEQ